MTKQMILKFDDPQADLANVGGKGASLARLYAAGLPVPAGFHITTAAYTRFVSDNDLQPRIMAAIQTANVEDPSSLESASKAIQGLFPEAQMSEELTSAILGAYKALTKDRPVVAVRSSATAEDLPDLSFAGQQETFLNIQGETALLESVKRCWSSLWTARAIGYRIRNRIDQGAVKLAVVVQLLVSAESAGILFTANPLNGRRDQLAINAAWGLGEAVVGGLVTPDTIIVSKTDGRILERETADKQVMTVRVEGGTREQPVQDARRRAPALDDLQVEALTRLGAQIEELYGMPMDIEWAFAGGRFAILQARPITALPEVEPDLPTGWKMPFKGGRALRNNIVELMADPLTPLFRTLGLAAVNAGMNRTMSVIFGGTGILPEELIIPVNEYAYYNGSFTPLQIVKILWKSPGIAKNMFTRPVERWTEKGRPAYIAAIASWKETEWQKFSTHDLLDSARQLTEAAIGAYMDLVGGVIPAAWMTEALFTKTYDALIQRKNDPQAPVFMLGFDNTPIRSDKALYDLAVWAKAASGLAAYLSNTSTQELASAILQERRPEEVPPAEWEGWLERFHAYLREYGHTIYNLDFASPVPADDPKPLLETIRLYMRGEGVNPHTRQEESVQRREAATQAMLSKLKRLRLKIFRSTLELAQRYGPLREDGLADIGLAYPIIRGMFHEAGHRFVEGGMIEKPEDIYFLEGDEVERAAARLDGGERLESLAAVVVERRNYWRALHRLSPPLMLPQMKLFGRNMEDIMKGRGKEDSDILKGVPASPGQVTGPACVLNGPEDFGKMKHGDVLVAAITTPAWTPLFARASAIVTDVGGPLSHGSIVAREYGIPAVLGTGEATSRIQDGAQITVDGSEGVVRLSLAA